MAREEVVEIAVRARIDDLRAELAKIPGVTKKEAGAMVRELEKQLRRAEVAAKKSGSAFDTLGRKAQGLKAAAMAAGGGLGGFASMADDAVTAAMLLGGPAGAFVAVAGAAALVTAGTVAYTKALVAIVESAGAAAERLEKLGTAHAADAEAIGKAQAALDSLDVAYDKLHVTLAGEIAPELERMAILVLASTMALDSMSVSTDGFRSTAIATARAVGGEGLAGAFTMLFLPMQMGVKIGNAALESSESAMGSFITKAENLVLELGAQGDAFEGTGKAAKDYTAELLAAAEANVALNAEVSQGLQEAWGANVTAALEGLAEVNAAASESAAERLKTELATIEAIRAANKASYDKDVVELEELKAKREAVMQIAMAGADQMLGYMSGIAQHIADSATAGLDEESEARKNAMRKAWEADKAIRLAQAGIATAVNMVALAAPPPIGLGPIPGPIFAGVLGAAAIAAIATEPAPKFHTGRAPDEVSATLTRSEGVANGRAMTTPGFREQLQAANEGTLATGPAGTVLVLNDRVLGVIVSRAMTQRGARVAVKQATLSPSGLGRGGYR